GAADPGQQHHKFVAAEPSHGIFLPNTPLQPLRDLAKQFVTGIMPQGIVDPFETVQIKEHQGCRLATSAAATNHVIQPIPEQLPVGESGQRIVESQPVQLRLGRLELGKIPRSEEHTSELQSRENLVCRLLLEKKK